MLYREIVKLRIRLDNQLTPILAHQLLSEMPSGDQSMYYDAWYRKFFKSNEYGNLLAWADRMRKWIIWLHGVSDKSVNWKIDRIQTVARQYQYQIGDKVVYYGINNDDESIVYSVVGRDAQGKIIVGDGSDEFGGFFMDRWRLATQYERKSGKRIMIFKEY